MGSNHDVQPAAKENRSAQTICAQGSTDVAQGAGQIDVWSTALCTDLKYPFPIIQVWTSVSGVQTMKDKDGPNLYKQMLDKPISEEIKNIITVDVPRTYPDNVYFYPTSENHSALFRILYAFAAQNPHVGYCQVHLKPIKLKTLFLILLKNRFLLFYFIDFKMVL